MMSLGLTFPQPVVGAASSFHYSSQASTAGFSPREEEESWMAQQDKEGHPHGSAATGFFASSEVVKPEQVHAAPAFDKAALFRAGSASANAALPPVPPPTTSPDTSAQAASQPVKPEPPVPPKPTIRSEEFISLRMPYDRDDEWRKGFMEVQPTTFDGRPATEELLENYTRNHKGMPRMLQPYQRVMRAGYDWRLSKRAPGVDLAFLRDQDKAFAELQEVLCGKPAKQGYQKAKPVHTGQEVKRRVGGRPSRLHGGVLPVIEVRDDGDIFIDGKLLIGTLYTKVMGMAYQEKAADPSWKIANGVVDRCYYQGSKRDARERPGSYFATDKAMVGDFVLRHPELFMSSTSMATTTAFQAFDEC